MTYRLVIQPEAEADLDEAYLWYEHQQGGLGRDFLECVEAVFDRIVATPEMHAVAYRSVRLALLRRFPYVVCYVLEENTVDVIAVYHGHRDPTIWQSRVDRTKDGPTRDD
jgi:plasmid stabilization system protein ParE